MKRQLLIIPAVALSATAFAQSAIDAYRLSQSDLKGTARFMGMGGAFGALGGDLSTISQNPAGIGVYRNSEIGVTVDLDLQNSESTTNLQKTSVDQTKFLLNNVGFVWTLKLPSSSCPNINLGFTYNKSASFNRRYSGAMTLNNSLSNYLAGVTTSLGIQEGQLIGDEYNNYDPWYPPADDDAAPWLSVLGYNGYLFSLSGNGPTDYVGLWNQKSSGFGSFDVQESGGVDSYNIALGGNISNVVFWGMDFDITHINYNLNPIWSENIANAYVQDTDVSFAMVPAKWSLENFYNCSGTGFNYKLGFIVKPIQELRLGFAFHTPTWYGLTETYGANLTYSYDNQPAKTISTDNGYPGVSDINFKTPWKLMGSIGAVLFNRLIISADYEWTQYKGMKYSYPSSYGWGGWDNGWGGWYDPWDPDYYPYANDYISAYDPIQQTNQEIQEYYCNTNTLRLGAEFKVTSRFSVRAGYSFVSSPVNSSIKNSEIYTSGTIPNYRFDNTTNYITCGLGYKVGNFYIDAAYVYKHMSSEYHAYTPYYDEFISSPTASLSLNNSQIVLSAGFKF